MAIELRKAQKQKAKLRMGVSGPSGSGKTYSALLLASGLTTWDKIAIIDTENGSADLYAHLGSYNVIPLTAPFTPERYIEAIHAAEEAGMEVVIVDSVTHEWDGKGGLLESNELLAQTTFKGNSWAAWSKTTPRHQKFIEAITTATIHIITTARSKTDTIQTEDKKIKKVGLKEIQREGFEYELTLNFTLDRDGHYAVASKDRTGLFIDKDPFVITKKVGEQIKNWAESGAEPLPAAAPVVDAQEEALDKAAEDQKNNAAKLPPVTSTPVKTPAQEFDEKKVIDPSDFDIHLQAIEDLKDVKEAGAYYKFLEGFEKNDTRDKLLDTLTAKGKVLREKAGGKK